MSIIFIFIQIKRGDNATIPPSIFRYRNVAVAACFSTFMGGGLFVLIYYSTPILSRKAESVPIYFQAIKGSTPSESGLQLLPLLISAIVVGIVCGCLVTWTGYFTPFIVVGSALFTMGAGLLTLVSVDQSSWCAYGFSIIAGAGYGFSLQNAYIAVQNVLPNEILPIGNAVVMFCQTFAYCPTGFC